MSFSELRLDDQAYGAFLRKLEYTENKVIERKYPEKKGANPKYFPMKNLSIPWADTTRYVLSDIVGGKFEIREDRTTNLSLVEVTGEEVIQRIYQYSKGYEFHEKEIARYLHLNLPIEEHKIRAIHRLYTNTLNDLVLFGDPGRKIPGMLNHPAFLRMTAPYPLDSTSTVSQMLATLAAGGEAMWKATEQIHTPSTLLLPPAKFRYLTEQVRLDTSTNDTTLLPFFLKNNMSIKNVDWMAELAGAGPGGTDMALYYTRNPEDVCINITDNLRAREYIRKPFGIQRPFAFDYGGIHAYQPFSVLLMYGV